MSEITSSNVNNLKQVLSFRVVKISITIFFIALVFFLLRFTVFSQNGMQNNSSQNKIKNNYAVYSVKIPEYLKFSGEEVPVYNFDVKEKLDRELLTNTYWHSSTFLSIKRAKRIFKIIEPILKKNNIPDDFKYIAVAKSGLYQSMNRGKLKGIWQLSETRAKQYKLEVNGQVDERFNIEKSTEAACKYFNDLYKKYKNWTLCAAAYNTGAVTLSKALLKQRVNTYYDLLLNHETARFVYKVISSKVILSSPIDYGFMLDESDLYETVPSYTVKVDSTISNMSDFAISHLTNYKVLRKLNPWIRSNQLLNKAKKTYSILIPKVGARNIYYNKQTRQDRTIKDTDIKDTDIKDITIKDTTIKNTIVKDTIIKDTIVNDVIRDNVIQDSSGVNIIK